MKNSNYIKEYAHTKNIFKFKTLREINSVVHDSSKFWQKWKKFNETKSNQ